MAYSVDLREKVIGAVDDGMIVSEAATIFHVCEKTIYLWLDLRDKTDSFEPKTGYQKGHSHKITDWDQFEKFAKEHGKCTASQMVVKWEKLTQVKASASVMKRALKKIDYTFKKKPLAMWKPMKKSGKSS